MLRERLAPFEGVVGDIRDEAEGHATTSSTRPLSEVMLPAPWFKGRVLLCGDAAHACAPHITQGAAMALEDAVVLAGGARGDRRARGRRLQPFGERRYPRAKFVQDVSRGILNAEMQINAENIEHAFAHMKEGLPGQMARRRRVPQPARLTRAADRRPRAHPAAGLPRGARAPGPHVVPAAAVVGGTSWTTSWRATRSTRR